MPRPLPARKIDAFLDHLAEGRTVKKAAEQAGISSTSHLYAKRKTDDPFRERWDHALEEGTQILEQEAIRRAIGYDVTRVDKNGNEYTASEHSDILLIFLLKSRRPDVYRDNVKHEHSGQIDLKVKAAADEFDRKFADRTERVRAIQASSNGDA